MGMKLPKGARIELTTDADYQPYAFVQRGERGTVEVSEPGYVEIKLDKLHSGLGEFHNRIWVTDDCEPFQYRKLASPKPGTWGLGAVAVIIVMVVVAGGADAMLTPAVERHSIKLLHENVPRGGALVIEQMAKRNKACLWSRTRTWSRTDTGEVVWVERGYMHGRPPNTEFEKEVHTVQIPDHLEQGRYKFESMGRGDCAGAVYWDTRPSFLFNITRQ